MKILTTNPRNEYAYVKNNVVYNINNVKDENDHCCTEITSANCTPINVTYTKIDGGTETKTYYLDVYIEDGDLVANEKFKPNDDHRLNYSGNPFSSYTEMYKQEAIEYVTSQMDRGISFSSATSTLPLYLKYQSNVQFSGDSTYNKLVTSDITPITINDTDFVNYVKYLAKKRGVECVNETLKMINKEIDKEDITIE